MGDALEELYEKYNILSDAKANVGQHSEEYLHCIKGASGSVKEKKLAAQIIVKFFKHFPALQDQALNAIIDLCEDDEDNNSVRISVIKLLPLLCKDSKEHVQKAADILAQLLQAKEIENITTTSLVQVYKEDPVSTVKAVFSLIHNVDQSSEEALLVREKSIQFFYKKLVKMEDKLSQEVIDLLIEGGKKIIQDSTGTEFTTVVPFLTTSKLAKTTTGQQELINLVAERAELDRDFDPTDEENLNCDRVIMCVDTILNIFNAHVPSTKFVKFYCDQVLTQWEAISKLKGGSILQYQFLKQLAELTTHCGTLDEPIKQVKQIFETMKEYMPLPPEDVDIEKMPNLDFTSVECLLYAFHRLTRQCPEFLTGDPVLLKDFRTRMNYFSRGVGGCKRSLDKVQSAKKDDEKIKIAPAVLDNITSLIKDLFYTTPIYKCNVQLSFKSLENKIKITAEKITPQKRHAPIQFDSSNESTTKQHRPNKGSDGMKLYTPPSGKFSNNFQSYGDRTGGRGRGRGGRGMRGSRGSSRGWRN